MRQSMPHQRQHETSEEIMKSNQATLVCSF
jgi:hypothetical protein